MTEAPVITKQLGKIRSVKFGHGGYDDAMLGFTFDLAGDGWAATDFQGYWREHSNHARWTVDEQCQQIGACALRVNKLMREAGVTTLADLAGKPVEVTFSNNAQESWRILTEVL